MAVTRHEARGNAREPDGGNAGTRKSNYQFLRYRKVVPPQVLERILRWMQPSEIKLHFSDNILASRPKNMYKYRTE